MALILAGGSPSTITDIFTNNYISGTYNVTGKFKKIILSGYVDRDTVSFTVTPSSGTVTDTALSTDTPMSVKPFYAIIENITTANPTLTFSGQFNGSIFGIS